MPESGTANLALHFKPVPLDTKELDFLESYNEHVKSNTPDEFGRVTFVTTLEKGPYIAYPRKPAVHHTMGGVQIDAETHALRADGTVIPGFFGQ